MMLQQVSFNEFLGNVYPADSHVVRLALWNGAAHTCQYRGMHTYASPTTATAATPVTTHLAYTSGWFAM
jgi:hypothetical protein